MLRQDTKVLAYYCSFTVSPFVSSALDYSILRWFKITESAMKKLWGPYRVSHMLREKRYITDLDGRHGTGRNTSNLFFSVASAWAAGVAGRNTTPLFIPHSFLSSFLEWASTELIFALSLLCMIPVRVTYPPDTMTLDSARGCTREGGVRYLGLRAWFEACCFRLAWYI